MNVIPLREVATYAAIGLGAGFVAGAATGGIVHATSGKPEPLPKLFTETAVGVGTISASLVAALALSAGRGNHAATAAWTGALLGGVTLGVAGAYALTAPKS